MSFLNPWLLVGLPLIAIPILIHLINQRRFQTTQWAAMAFLLAAKNANRGYARVRQWLILAARTLALAGLILAISRPLASGVLGWSAGTQPDVTLILLDRSPSMQQSAAGAESKLEAARRQLRQSLSTRGSRRWVLIDHAADQPREFDSLEELLDSPFVEPLSSSASVPQMLLKADQYLRANQAGRADIWVCSDLNQHDWQITSGGWDTLRSGLSGRRQDIQLYVLAYPQRDPTNRALQLTETQLQDTERGPELVLSLRVHRPASAEGVLPENELIPLRIDINQARVETELELAGEATELKEYRIPLERGVSSGWGRVSLPADSNVADNEAYFVFEPPRPRRAAIVCQQPLTAATLRMATSITPDPAIPCTSEVVDPAQWTSLPWEELSLVVWCEAIPDGDAAAALREFVERGGAVMFLPPEAPDSNEFLGCRWDQWKSTTLPIGLKQWRDDQDLVAHTLAGAALPLGDLQVQRYCSVAGDLLPLATLESGEPLLTRTNYQSGHVYYLGTLPQPPASSLAENGLALYIPLQRAMALGARALANVREQPAGTLLDVDTSSWAALSDSVAALSSEYAHQAGVYRTSGQLLAVNRALEEDHRTLVDNDRLGQLFAGIRWTRVDDTLNSGRSLVQEIWRLFLVAMVVALLGEAILCLPRARRTAGALR
jgi:hypothetical protein